MSGRNMHVPQARFTLCETHIPANRVCQRELKETKQTQMQIKNVRRH